MPTTIKNYTSDHLPEQEFIALLDLVKDKLGWKNFFIHHLREDGACESQINCSQTDFIHNPLTCMVGSIIESLVLQCYHEQGGEEPPEMGTDEYLHWLKIRAVSMVVSIMNHRS